MLTEMAARLGFREDDSLAAARSAVLEAIRSADRLGYQAAWEAFQRLAEVQIEALLDGSDAKSKALIGLILVKADIWRAAKDRVRYLHELGLAEAATDELSEEGEDSDLDEVGAITGSALSRAVTSHSFLAEFLQAREEYEYAIEAYIEREQDECLTDRERGLVNLRLAECYQGLLHKSTDDPESVQELLETTVQSALEYLKDEPEQIVALRILDELEQAS